MLGFRHCVQPPGLEKQNISADPLTWDWGLDVQTDRQSCDAPVGWPLPRWESPSSHSQHVQTRISGPIPRELEQDKGGSWKSGLLRTLEHASAC